MFDTLVGSIDTDKGIGTILSNFESEYINHIVEDSLNMKFRPFNSEPMPNIVDVLKRKFNAIYQNTLDYKDKVKETEIETYKEIINIICSYYNLGINNDNFENIDEENLFTVAHLLYEIFISKFTEYMVGMFTAYIMNNAKDIISSLSPDDIAKKPKKSGMFTSKLYSQEFAIIHANLNKIIYNMAAYDIPFYYLLTYLTNKNIADYLSRYIYDNNDLYKNYYAYYILDDRYKANLITSIKLALQSKTQETVNI